MRIAQIVLEATKCGFSASAQIESAHGPNERLWYEASRSPVLPTPEMVASAFVAACLPTAVWWEDDLHVDSPVDADFLFRLPRLARGLARLHARKRATIVHATGISSEPRPNRVVGMSFTGGVDSFYTLRDNLDPKGVTPVRALVTGLGLDLKVDDIESHRALLERLENVSREYDLDHYAIRTNFRDLFDPYSDPGLVSQGSCLVAFAFLLSGSLKAYLIPSTYPIDWLIPYSSHALTDGAWISRPIMTISDGWDRHRNEKLATLVDWPLAMRELHVCTEKKSATNCGRCEKCVRTMAILAVNGVLDSPAFPRLEPEAIERLRVRKRILLRSWGLIVRQARQNPDNAWIARSAARMVLRMRVRTVLRRHREKAKERRRWPHRRFE